MPGAPSKSARTGAEFAVADVACRIKKTTCSSQFLSHAQVAVVVNHTYPVRWMGRQPVVALPEHIDVSNASQIREELPLLTNRGAALIADMTATLSCDHSGADAVMRAYQRAPGTADERSARGGSRHSGWPWPAGSPVNPIAIL
jgi:hypothetical protein